MTIHANNKPHLVIIKSLLGNLKVNLEQASENLRSIGAIGIVYLREPRGQSYLRKMYRNESARRVRFPGDNRRSSRYVLCIAENGFLSSEEEWPSSKTENPHADIRARPYTREIHAMLSR